MSRKTIGILSSFLLYFIAFGYPIQTFIPFLLNIDSSSTNMGFRVFLLFLSIYLIVVTIFVGNKQKRSGRDEKSWSLFLIFWVIYGSRLIYDIEIKHLVYLDTDSFYTYSFAFGVCLMPSIAVYETITYIDIKKSLYIMFAITVCANICLAYMVLSVINWNIMEALTSRATVSIETALGTKNIVNPITIGFLGQTLASTSIRFLSLSTFTHTKSKYFLYSCLLLGLINLIIGASRGPIVFFVVLLLFEFYLNLKKIKDKTRLLLKVGAGIIMLLVYASSWVITKIQDGDIEIINRLFSTYEARQNSEEEIRDIEWEGAWQQFKNNPALGDAFITDFDQSYSHNLLLDVLMATGLIGALFFSGFMWRILTKLQLAVSKINSNPYFSLFYILFLGSFLISLTSGSLFMSSSFWLLSAAALALK